tara:strand:+ start:65 stop:376 length:312 start_codon:yes stop_codon:yes gene_type:complete
MIKLKKLLKEQKFAFDRKFGESLPTLSSVIEKHQSKDEETIVEWSMKVTKSDTIDSKTWRQMKYDLRDQFDELVDIGEDYGVFQNAKGTHKMLKQIKKIMDRI